MNREHYNTEDFLNDESFQAYALKLDKKEESYWQKWLEQHPEKVADAQKAIQILTSFTVSALKVDEQKFEQDFKRIRNTIGDEGRPEAKMLRMFYSFGLKVAASITLAILLGVAGYYYSVQEAEIESVTVMEKSNPKGRKSRVMLPDGSVVRLNAQSHIRYEEEEGLRNVYLTGEAFFEVAEDKTRPFTVYSAEISTTALGTSFNVKAYPSESKIEVFLASGKVEIKEHARKDPSKLVLSPGEGIDYDRNARELTYAKEGSNKPLAWTEGIIVFDKADFAQVKVALERWYGVDIEVKGKPDPAWRINGSFENESLVNILNSMAFTTPLDYSIEGNKLIIRF